MGGQLLWPKRRSSASSAPPRPSLSVILELQDGLFILSAILYFAVQLLDSRAASENFQNNRKTARQQAIQGDQSLLPTRKTLPYISFILLFTRSSSLPGVISCISVTAIRLLSLCVCVYVCECKKSIELQLIHTAHLAQTFLSTQFCLPSYSSSSNSLLPASTHTSTSPSFDLHLQPDQEG
jgi:hypothetical protein